MSKTKRHGWMRREWNKFPLGSNVICINDIVYYKANKGTVIGYGIAKNSYPTLHIRLDTGEVITGQLVSWYKLI